MWKFDVRGWPGGLNDRCVPSSPSHTIPSSRFDVDFSVRHKTVCRNTGLATLLLSPASTSCRTRNERGSSGFASTSTRCARSLGDCSSTDSSTACTKSHTRRSCRAMYSAVPQKTGPSGSEPAHRYHCHHSHHRHHRQHWHRHEKFARARSPSSTFHTMASG